MNTCTILSPWVISGSSSDCWSGPLWFFIHFNTSVFHQASPESWTKPMVCCQPMASYVAQCRPQIVPSERAYGLIQLQLSGRCCLSSGSIHQWSARFEYLFKHPGRNWSSLFLFLFLRLTIFQMCYHCAISGTFYFILHHDVKCHSLLSVWYCYLLSGRMLSFFSAL